MHRALPSISLVLMLGTIASGAQDSFRLQTEIPGVITEGTPLEVFVGGFQGLEGPVGALDGTLYFSDIPANRTYKIDAKGMMSVWRENTNGANGLFMTKDGRLLAAEGSGRRIVAVMADGRVMPLATQFKGQPFGHRTISSPTTRAASTLRTRRLVRRPTSLPRNPAMCTT
jgi:gluconolactonase